MQLTPDAPVSPSPGPAASTPPRRAPSVRRTTTHDSRRPEGLLGAVSLIARGRDLRTGAGGEATVIDAAALEVSVDYRNRTTISALVAEPPDPRLERLVGVPAASGFRRAVLDAMPAEAASRSVRFQLLDDLPTALLVSGYAIHAGGVDLGAGPGPMLERADICAGWARGGTLLARVADEGAVPAQNGPPAPSVEREDDPFAWHQIDPLPANGMRRRRRLDVWDEGGLARVECWFRDSHMSAEGVETVVHEYTVRATVDRETMRFRACQAEIGSLPWPECPNAVASAGRLQGAPVEGLRPWVRKTFTGPTTCTHLNDTLRSLEDVGGLLRALP